MTILAQWSIKTLNKRGTKVEPFGTPDNTEKGGEDISKMKIKEDLVDK
jgi:hypothetical protein